MDTVFVHTYSMKTITENGTFQKRSPEWIFLKTLFSRDVWTDETTDVTQSVAIHSAQHCKHIQDGEQALQFLACFQANLDFLFLPADYSRRRQNIIRLLSLPVSKGGRLKRLGGCPPRPRRFWVRPGRTSAWTDNFLAHIVIVKVNTRASGLRSWVIVTKLSFSKRVDGAKRCKNATCGEYFENGDKKLRF